VKIALHWLKKHIALNASLQEISDKLTFAGLEVEHVEEISSVQGGLKGLIIGEVLTCVKHPNADKLKVTTVNIGANSPLNIVCGAPNVAAGQKVVVAPVGSTIYPTDGGELTLRNAKIRGEESQGMICAEDEIGLGKSHDGILVLPETSTIGQLAADYFKIETNTIIDIGLTANRGDAASHLGVARDLSALFDQPLIKQDISLPMAKENNNFTVTIHDSEACPRYCGILLKNIKVAPSPEWLKKDLLSIGINPINNIVDSTNYVLHNIGQPIHAFDAQKVEGNAIHVRKATENKVLITLDDKERKLNAEDLVICDASKPLALAGVFGGLHSGITQQTTEIFIESAYFHPTAIRKTAKRYGLNTDASFRYERGANPDFAMRGLIEAVNLIMQISDAYIASDVIDNYPNKINPFAVQLKFANIKRILGIAIPKTDIKRILQRLEIEIVKENDAYFDLSVPAFKSDVTREIDVIEELIRIYGFESIPLKGKSSLYLTGIKSDLKTRMRSKAAPILQGLGYSEIMNNSMVSVPKSVTESDVFLENPLSADTGKMRTDLKDGLLQSISYNLKRRNKDLKFYENGTVFSQVKNQRYVEKQNLAIACVGNVYKESWQFDEKEVDVAYLQNCCAQTLEGLGVKDAKKQANCFVVSPQQIEKTALKQFEIDLPVVYAELSWQKIINAVESNFVLQEIPLYPSIRRDLSLVIDKHIQFDEIKKITLKVAGNLLQDVNVFDVFEGKPLDENKKSYAISFVWQNKERTLEDKEIDPIADKLIQSFEKELGAVIRR